MNKGFFSFEFSSDGRLFHLFTETLQLSIYFVLINLVKRITDKYNIVHNSQKM